MSIVVVGTRNDAVLRFVHGRPVRVVDRAELASALDVVGPGADHLVLVGEHRDEAAVRQHAALLSDLGHPVARVLLPHGPSAIVAIAVTASSVSVDPGRVPEVVSGIAARVWSGAWTPSVRWLAGIDVPMGLHLRSLLPGGSFFAELSPRPRVWATGSQADLGGGFSGGSVLVFGDLGGRPEVARLAARLGAPRTTAVADLGLAPARVGHREAVEVCAFSADLSIPMPTAAGSTCPSCGAERRAAFCPFCHTRRAELVATFEGASR